LRKTLIEKPYEREGKRIDESDSHFENSLLENTQSPRAENGESDSNVTAEKPAILEKPGDEGRQIDEGDGHPEKTE
jgi:hypothetical protein